MKTNNVILIIGALTLLISSCKPFYQCGQPRPEKFFASKRVQAVINERDSLCETLELRENEIYSLNSNIAGLKQNIVSLNKTLADTKKKYDDLVNENLTQAEEFNLAMKQKSDELLKANVAKAGLNAFIASMVTVSLTIAIISFFKTWEAAAIAIALVFTSQLLTFIISFNYYEKRGNL
jgi:hypothetical protein